MTDDNKPSIQLTVLGPAVPKARPKFARVAHGVRTYTPTTTVSYMALIQSAYVKAYKEMVFGHHEPIVIEAWFYLVKPKSAPRKRIYPVVKPDTLNMGQAVQDALEGFAYPNDAQIITVIAHKRYSYPPRTVITVRVATEEDGCSHT